MIINLRLQCQVLPRFIVNRAIPWGRQRLAGAIRDGRGDGPRPPNREDVCYARLNQAFALVAALLASATASSPIFAADLPPTAISESRGGWK
jgi:hypothetical protein